MNNIHEQLKDIIIKDYGIQEDLDCTLGDTVKENTNIVLSMRGEQLVIPRADSTESAISAIRRYLSKQLPTGRNMQFSVFQRAFFKIETLFDDRGIYCIVIFSDKKSNFEEALYLRWDNDSQEWVKADRKLQVWEKIRIKYGRENIGSIKIVKGSEFLVNPRVAYEENTVEIPQNIRTKDTIRKIRIISEEPYRVEIEVQNIAMVYVAKKTRKLKASWRKFIFYKQDNAPVRKSEIELEVPSEWNEAFKGELDFEQNPLNTAVHDLLSDCPPKYAGNFFYVTHSGQFWVRSQNSWIPVHADYLHHYVNIDDIKNEANLYEMMQELIGAENN